MLNNFSVRQGTIYEDIASKKHYLLVNHNIMNMDSLLLEGEGETFDIYKIRHISVDEIIAMRKSDKFKELGDLDSEEFVNLLRALLDSNALTHEDIPFVEALYAEAFNNLHK